MKKIELSPKAKKIINIVVDVVVVIVLFFAVFLAVNTIRSKVKGYSNYTEILGKAYLAVSSDSMAKDCETGEVKEDNFAKGDMIRIRLLSKGAMSSLKPGDIITYNTKGIEKDENGEDKWVLNTHRIVSMDEYNGGYTFVTRGDNVDHIDPGYVTDDLVVGVYEGKVENVGFIMLFMGSSTGFILFVLVPSLLIVAYAAFNLVMVIKKEKKVQAEVADKAHTDMLDEERERIRQELLAEMRGENGAPADNKAPEVKPVEEKAPESVEVKPADEKAPESVESTQSVDDKDNVKENNGGEE